eukprot:5823701-Pleurochrysis_carterae.AAC.1
MQFGAEATHAWVSEVDRLAGVVGEYPRYNRVLRQVRIGAAGERVEAHQVLKVGDLALLPRARPNRNLGLEIRSQIRPARVAGNEIGQILRQESLLRLLAGGDGEEGEEDR